MMQPTLSSLQNELFTLLPPYLTEFLTPKTEEIRFRRNCPVIFLENGQELITPYRFDSQQMEDLVDHLTEGSLSSCFESINEGYLTVKGGHRIGLSGTAVYDGNRLTYVKDISSVNFRIAKEVPGAADRLFQAVGHLDPLPGILIISPPGHGKTTLLRDFLRQLSEKRVNLRIAVVDERGEIAATWQGEMQNRLGIRCDILNRYQKSDGIRSAIRSLSPNVIAVDEIGTSEDEKSLLYAYHTGVSIIATIHGDNTDQFRKNIKKLTREQVFSYEVYVSKHCSCDRIEVIKRTNGESNDKTVRIDSFDIR